MAVVVSDASPLICLAAIRRFDLLASLYGEVLIPESGRRSPMPRPLQLPHRLAWLQVPETRAGCKSPARPIVPSSRSSIAAKQRRSPWP
jgi:hypothetical protein